MNTTLTGLNTRILYKFTREEKIRLLQDQLGTAYKDIKVEESYSHIIDDQLLKPINFKSYNLNFNSNIKYTRDSIFFQFSINKAYMDGSLVDRLTFILMIIINLQNILRQIVLQSYLWLGS
jgi:hypothetical protein